MITNTCLQPTNICLLGPSVGMMINTNTNQQIPVWWGPLLEIQQIQANKYLSGGALWNPTSASHHGGRRRGPAITLYCNHFVWFLFSQKIWTWLSGQGWEEEEVADQRCTVEHFHLGQVHLGQVLLGRQDLHVHLVLACFESALACLALTAWWCRPWWSNTLWTTLSTLPITLTFS